MHIGQSEYNNLRNTQTGFVSSLISNSGMEQSAIRKAFMEKTGPVEKLGLIACRFWAERTSGDYEARAGRFVRYCEKNVVPLTRVFGQQALVESMRQQPERSAKLAEMVEGLGGRNIASIIRRSL
jgi:hypothetical protein